jgi:hypothetical protein
VVNLIGEKKVSRLEKVAEVFIAIANGGLGKLWQFVSQDLGDLGETVMGGIKDWIISTLVQKGIATILEILTPAGALVKIVETVINIVQWLATNASRIMGLVNSVLDSVEAIVNGNIGGAVAKIEQSLANMLPIAISLLADLAGLGGITAKVQEIIGKVRAKVDSVIDKLLQWVINKFKGLFSKKDSSKETTNDETHKDPKPTQSLEDKEKLLQQALTAAVATVNQYNGKKVKAYKLKSLLEPIRNQFQLKSLKPVKSGQKWAIYGKINPEATQETLVWFWDDSASLKEVSSTSSQALKYSKNLLDAHPKDFSWLHEEYPTYQGLWDKAEKDRVFLEQEGWQDKDSEDSAKAEFRQAFNGAEKIKKTIESKHPPVLNQPSAERMNEVKNAAYNNHGYKHLKATTDAEAEKISSVGDAQYLPMASMRKLGFANGNADIEKKALDFGQRYEDSEGNKGVVYFFHKFDNPIGYDEGVEAYWVRAELSNNGSTYHGHPMNDRRFQIYYRKMKKQG